MGKTVTGGAVAVALAVALSAAAQAVAAQAPPPGVPRTLDMLLLQGGGSEIGVSVRDLTNEEIAAAKLTPPGGVLVQEVREGSPASRAGLVRGDIIVEFDGERVRSAGQFTRLVRESASGREVKAGIVRQSARRDVQITPQGGDRRASGVPELSQLEPRLRALPQLPDFPPDLDPTPDLKVTPPRGQIGATLSPLSEQLATYFGTKEGVLVSTVTTGSAAAQAGLKAGDVITQVNGRRVQGVADVTRAVREAKPGAAIDMRVLRDKKEMSLKVIVPELVTEPRSISPV